MISTFKGNLIYVTPPLKAVDRNALSMLTALELRL